MALRTWIGEDFVFQTEIVMNLEASQVAARHFKLAMFRQQQGTTSKTPDRGGRLPHSSGLRGEPKNSNNSTSRRPREGCDQPATARGDVD